MSYDDTGTGPAVLLLHSGVCDRRMWAAQTEVLSKQFRVVTPDLRGFGDTGLPPGLFSYSSDVAELLDELAIEQVNLVGSSFGGKIALEVASRWPDRVASLVLLCTALGDMEPTPAAREFESREEALLAADDVHGAVELNVATWLGPDASPAAAELVRVMQRRAFDVQLAAEEGDEQPDAEPYDADPRQVTARTLVVSGGLDMDHFQQIATRLAELIPDAELVTLPWAAHLPSLERPGETTELIRTFLRGRLD